MSLNALQQYAFNEVLYGPERVIVLTGEGGSGKTYVAAEIAQRTSMMPLVTATTNKAATVLREVIDDDVTTAHSAMGFALRWCKNAQILQQIKPPTYGQLVIVDEVSMLPTQVYKALLATKAVKILLLGDPIQLEAIGSQLNLDTVTGKCIELTQQMRQLDIDPKTVAYFKALRYAIEHNLTPPKIPRDSSDITFVSSHKEFSKAYYNAIGSKKIMAFKNSCVDRYNRRISGGVNEFNVGDSVIIGAPIINSVFKNGATLTITDIKELSDRFLIKLNNSHSIYNWKSKKAMQAVLDPLIQNKRWQEFYRIKETTIDIKHPYACTVHKSQGSSYDNVFLDLTDIQNSKCSINSMMRLVYVALSRMRKRIFIFDGTKRDYKVFTPN